jgi:peroxiredoxin
MMKKLLVIIAIFIMSAGVKALASNFLYYKLHGCKSKTAVLYGIRGNETKAVDTARIQQSGGFAFTGIERYPAGMYVVRFNDSIYTEIIINGEDIVLEADVGNILMTMEVKRSRENQILFTYWQYAIYIKDSVNTLSLMRQKVIQKNRGMENAKSQMLDMKIFKMNEKLYKFIREQHTLYPEALAPKLLLAYQIPSYKHYLAEEGNEPYASEMEYYKIHFFDNIDFSDARLLNSKIIYVSISDYLKNFGSPASTANYEAIIDKVMTLASANDEVYHYCLDLFLRNFDNTIWEDVFVYIVDKYYRNSYVESPQTAAYYFNKAERIKKLKPGKKAPDFVLPDTTGNLVQLYKTKAKAKILVFYASDCPHCEEAMPSLKEIYNQYKDLGVVIIGIALDDDAALWKNHIRKDSLPWISVSDLKGMVSPVVDSYNIWMTPTIFILDKNNVIMKKPKGTTDIHTTLIQLIY